VEALLRLGAEGTKLELVGGEGEGFIRVPSAAAGWVVADQHVVKAEQLGVAGRMRDQCPIKPRPANRKKLTTRSG
jgi:hypothetical protein